MERMANSRHKVQVGMARVVEPMIRLEGGIWEIAVEYEKGKRQDSTMTRKNVPWGHVQIWAFWSTRAFRPAHGSSAMTGHGRDGSQSQGRLA